MEKEAQLKVSLKYDEFPIILQMKWLKINFMDHNFTSAALKPF